MSDQENQYTNPPLKRHAALQPFSRDHQAGLVCARHLTRAADKDADARRRAAREFAEAWSEHIAEHFDDEERLLLPLMNDADRARMTDEHADLRARAEQARAHAGDPDPGADPGADWTRTTGRALHDHIRWEERTLFPAIEHTATGEALALLKSHTDEIEAARPRNACRPNDEA